MVFQYAVVKKAWLDIHYHARSLEYLYHNVGYCSIITKLHSDAPVMIDAGVDYLVYEWIE